MFEHVLALLFSSLLFKALRVLAELFIKSLADALELELRLGLVLASLAELGLFLKAGSLKGLGTVLLPLLEVL